MGGEERKKGIRKENKNITVVILTYDIFCINTAKSFTTLQMRKAIYCENRC